jgi:hypothetical protein
MAGETETTEKAEGTVLIPPAEAEESKPQGNTALPDTEKLSVTAQMGTGSGRPWTPAERLLLTDWAARVTAAQHAHYFLMTRLRRRNLWLGIPVVVLSTIVGTALFATVATPGDYKAPLGFRLAAAFISVLTAVLAGVQTFLKFSERSERHGLAADWLAAVRRDIDLLQATPEKERGNPRETLSSLRKEINKIAQNAPAIGEALWHSYAAKYNVREPTDA